MLWGVHCSIFTTIYRLLVQAVLMTGSDLCASSKPWELQLQTVDAIYAEFYHQGDVELEAGRVPVPIMNRCFLDQRALHQVQKNCVWAIEFSSPARNMWNGSTLKEFALSKCLVRFQCVTCAYCKYFDFEHIFVFFWILFAWIQNLRNSYVSLFFVPQKGTSAS